MHSSKPQVHPTCFPVYAVTSWGAKPWVSLMLTAELSAQINCCQPSDASYWLLMARLLHSIQEPPFLLLTSRQTVHRCSRGRWASRSAVSARQTAGCHAGPKNIPLAAAPGKADPGENNWNSSHCSWKGGKKTKNKKIHTMKTSKYKKWQIRGGKWQF